ncbi:hypothetical protein Lal_00019613 [Lupinus albus]|uniref:Chlorophyll a-b binding protein, chloroplastic n=1 Tax=Lupinus albus TaxID=3870 RepID=A0A6A4R6G0_LUPAL|nr:putative chlorophyll A-B binding protein [Lupinus albus]KAF1899485.1 hypothetical protein Lal_00019613 [Lupinus albus]
MATNTLMSSVISAFPSPICSSKTRSPTLVAASRNGTKSSGSVSTFSEWFPGQPRPAHLDGSAPADFGFDPLGLAVEPENFERFKESEVFHSRLTMFAVIGVLLPEALGLGNWVQAQEWTLVPGGQATYLGFPVPWGTLPIIVAIEVLAVAFAEIQRVYEQDTEKKKYPGGYFDPLGYSKDPQKFEEYKVKEIKNGRFAMLACVGFAVQQAFYPGTGPLDNLASHLADPWHNNVGNILFPNL